MIARKSRVSLLLVCLTTLVACTTTIMEPVYIYPIEFYFPPSPLVSVVGEKWSVSVSAMFVGKKLNPANTKDSISYQIRDTTVIRETGNSKSAYQCVSGVTASSCTARGVEYLALKKGQTYIIFTLSNPQKTTDSVRVEVVSNGNQ